MSEQWKRVVMAIRRASWKRMMMNVCLPADVTHMRSNEKLNQFYITRLHLKVQTTHFSVSCLLAHCSRRAQRGHVFEHVTWCGIMDDDTRTHAHPNTEVYLSIAIIKYLKHIHHMYYKHVFNYYLRSLFMGVLGLGLEGLLIIYNV